MAEVRRFGRFWVGLRFQRQGLMALEYGLIMAIIGAVAVSGAHYFGGVLASSYQQMSIVLTTEVSNS